MIFGPLAKKAKVEEGEAMQKSDHPVERYYLVLISTLNLSHVLVVLWMDHEEDLLCRTKSSPTEAA